MIHFRKHLYILVTIFFLIGCKGKKTVSPTGDEPIESDDFIGFYQPVKLPYQFDAKTMVRKENDSMVISRKVLTQFIPDSIVSTVFSKTATTKIYPLGRVEASPDEQYLFTKIVSTKGNLIAGLISVFNKKNEHENTMVIWRSDRDMTKSMQATATLDTRYTVIRSQARKNPDGSTSEGRDIYAYSADTKEFMLIMTDAIGDRITEIINPIDTISRKHKYAGDYISGKMTLVSIRDGRKADRLNFFIHFEKNNGECTGELKGEALLRSASLAEYRQGGDPCVLQFRFTSSSVTLKELEGCGAHRGLRCAFDGTYARKKEPKAKTPKKKSSAKK
jgi:hypothetical protein